jgi:hypothetical protein
VWSTQIENKYIYPQLKKILTFSVKDRYQLNYFICIKDLNTETITSLKWNLFSFFIGCCQHYETKKIYLYIFLISDRYCGTEHQYLFSRFLGGRYYFVLWQTNNNTPNTMLLSESAVSCLLCARSVSFTSRAKGCIKFAHHSCLMSIWHKVGVFLEEAFSS